MNPRSVARGAYVLSAAGMNRSPNANDLREGLKPSSRNRVKP
jgi:hypothetical protein